VIPHRYPRTARVSRVLREIIAEELERIGSDDPRLVLLTVTGVEVDPDLRHAIVWMGSLSDAAAEALGENRARVQAAIGTQVRMKRTPQLRFVADPAVASGNRIEDILRTIDRTPVPPVDETAYAAPSDRGPDDDEAVDHGPDDNEAVDHRPDLDHWRDHHGAGDDRAGDDRAGGAGNMATR